MTIESEEFYNLCQRYRFASIGNQDEVSAAYQDLIKFIDGKVGKGIAPRLQSHLIMDKAEKNQVKPVTPDFFQLENGSEYWFECPDDAAIIGDLTDVEIGTEYDVFASHTYRQTYRVTKLPDEKDDDTEVELVSSQRTYYTSPPDQSAKIAEREAEVARLKAITLMLLKSPS